MAVLQQLCLLGPPCPALQKDRVFQGTSSAGAGELCRGAAVPRSRRAAHQPCSKGEASLLFALTKPYFALAFKGKIVWVEKNADLPCPAKRSERGGREEQT